MTSLSDKAKFVQRVFGRYELARNGIDAAVKCPNSKCDSRRDPNKKKLVIRLDTDVCHCWVCGLKGRNLLRILRDHFSPSDYQEYVDKFYKGEILTGDPGINDNNNDRISLPEDFRLIAENLQSTDPDTQAIIRYLRSREITNRDMWYFKLGFSNEKKFIRRVIIPSFDHSGHLNYFVARSIDKNKFVYLNSKTNKTDIIFNDLNIDWSRPLTVTEGPFDLMKCDDNSTCLLGSSLSEKSKLFQKILLNNTQTILALDADMGKKTQIFARRLTEYGIHVRTIPLMGKSDVGEMTKLEFSEAKKMSRRWSYRDMLISRIQSISSGSFV